MPYRNSSAAVIPVLVTFGEPNRLLAAVERRQEIEFGAFNDRGTSFACCRPPQGDAADAPPP